jgi:serine/threonine protein kinase
VSGVREAHERNSVERPANGALAGHCADGNGGLLAPCAAEHPTVDALPPPAQQRLAELLEQCLAELEQGREPDVVQMTRDQPELAGPLRAYLGSLNFLQRAGAGLGQFSEPPAGPDRNVKKELGDYEVLREIGRGGMGVVYEARQISLDRRVALKVLPLAGLLDQKQIARFQKEARAAAQLHHPHIVPIFSVGCERGVHYYAMQFIEGRALDQALRELRESSVLPDGPTARRKETSRRRGASSQLAKGGTGPPFAKSGAGSPPAGRGPSSANPWQVGNLPHIAHKDYFRAVASLGIQAARALHHAHEYGIIHRDIKPSNLLLDGEGKLWVTDFGLARFQAEADRTATGDVVGTLHYMSPEQAAGKSALIDPRTDVYSLETTLYELLTLRVPFAGSDRQQLLRRIVEEEPVGPRHLNPAVPADFETIVLKAIAKAREERYATAQDLAEDLQRFLDGHATLARRPTRMDRAAKWVKRHRRTVWAAVALMAVAVVGLATSTFLVLNEHGKTQAALARAEANLMRARRAADSFSTRAAEELASVPGAERLRHELLIDALGYCREFIEQAGEDRGLQAELAATHYRIASITEQLGDCDDALASYREAQQRFERLTHDTPQSAEHRGKLALCDNQIGLLLGRKGQPNEAEESFRRAIDLLTRLVAEEHDPAQLDKHRNDLALCHGNLALLLGQERRSAEAEASYRAAIEVQQKLAAEHPERLAYTAALALSYNNLSYLLSAADAPRAERCCRQAIAIQEELVAREPTAVVFQSDLALSHNNLGALENRTGRADNAQKSYRKAIDLQRQLTRRAPTVLQYRRDLAVSYNNLGRLLSQVRQLPQAEEAFREARGILEDLVRDHPAELNYRSDLGGTLNNLARAMEQSGRTDEAVKTCAEAVEHQRFAQEHAPQVARFREFLIQQYENYARLLRIQKRASEAETIVAACDKLRSRGMRTAGPTSKP